MNHLNKNIESKKHKHVPQKGDSFYALILEGSKIESYKMGKVHLNGEFMAYFKTVNGKFYFCNCEFNKKGIRFYTKIEINKANFEAFNA